MIETRMTTVTPDSIRDAAALLRAGGLVVIPTETVYGLAANALDDRAVARIFEAKGRPSFNPLIIHGSDADMLSGFVEMNDRARRLAMRFWPGPLTMVLPRRQDCPVSLLAGAGLPTLAVRVPSHPAARAVIEAAGVPLAAPSANRSGTVSGTTPKLVMDTLGGRVDMVLAAGPCAVGLESTVVDISGATPILLRPGAVTKADLEDALDEKVEIVTKVDPEKPQSPGLTLRHYAPSIPLRLYAVDVRPGEALLGFGSLRFMGVRGGGAAKDLPETALRNLSEDGDLTEAAANLFAMIDALDRPENEAIAVMNIPETGLGVAINDRLRRAAASR